MHGFRSEGIDRWLLTGYLALWFGKEAVGGGYKQYNCAIVGYNNLQCTIAMVWYRGGWL